MTAPRVALKDGDFLPGVAYYFDGQNLHAMEPWQAIVMMETALNDAERERLTGPNND